MDAWQRLCKNMGCVDQKAPMTGRPDYLSVIEHRAAEAAGWGIFNANRPGGPFGEVQRIDEMGLLEDDDAAVKLARKKGLLVLDDGRVLGRWREEKDALVLEKTSEPLPKDAEGQVDLDDRHLLECLGEDFQEVKPEEVGALTSGLILARAREVERDEQGKLLKVGVVYWDANYQVANLWQTLEERGEVRLFAARS